MRGGVVLVALLGCGRVSFGELPDGGVDANGRSFDYDFVAECPPAGLVLVDAAACITDALRVNSAIVNTQGAVYVATAQQIDGATSFSTQLTVRVTAPGPMSPGDGLVFVIHADPAGTTAIGAGGGMGYDMITPSLAVELDTFLDGGPNDPNSNHLGIDRDGGLMSVALGTPPFAMTGSTFTVWIDYDGATDVLRATADLGTVQPTGPLVFTTDDISRLGPLVWIGLTAGEGFAQEAHDVLAWRVTLTP